MPNEWIKHDGMGRPIPLGQLVEIRCACGQNKTAPCDDWLEWGWTNPFVLLFGHPIAEYRVIGGGAFNMLRDIALNAKVDELEVVE